MFNKIELGNDNMGNFCINCGAKLEKDYNYCGNCGTKIDKEDMKQDTSLKSVQDKYEKERARNQLKKVMGGGILFKASFTEEILRMGIGFNTAENIKKQVYEEIDSGKIKSGEVEDRINQLMQENKIRIDQKRAEEEARIAKEKEMRRKQIENTPPTRGGYCSFTCIHFYEEFFDSYGGIVGDMEIDGYVEYYCNLGHHICEGCYCEDYE